LDSLQKVYPQVFRFVSAYLDGDVFLCQTPRHYFNLNFSALFGVEASYFKQDCINIFGVPYELSGPSVGINFGFVAGISGYPLKARSDKYILKYHVSNKSFLPRKTEWAYFAFFSCMDSEYHVISDNISLGAGGSIGREVVKAKLKGSHFKKKDPSNIWFSVAEGIWQ
jgi:hypothetical protein